MDGWGHGILDGSMGSKEMIEFACRFVCFFSTCLSQVTAISRYLSVATRRSTRAQLSTHSGREMIFGSMISSTVKFMRSRICVYWSI